jgi:hypothetical protein
MRCNKRRRLRGGGSGYKAEVPQEATGQPAGVNKRQTGGGVAATI